MMKLTLLVAGLGAWRAAASGGEKISSPEEGKRVHMAKKTYKTTPGLPLATLGVFYDKACNAFPHLVLGTPRECRPGPCVGLSPHPSRPRGGGAKDCRENPRSLPAPPLPSPSPQLARAP